eukprot:s576_g36.t2
MPDADESENRVLQRITLPIILQRCSWQKQNMNVEFSFCQPCIWASRASPPFGRRGFKQLHWTAYLCKTHCKDGSMAIRSETSLRALPKILVSLGRSQHWEDAILELNRVQKEANNLPQKKLWASSSVLCCYNATISACRFGTAWQAGIVLLQELLNQGPKPDHVTFAASIHAIGGSENGLKGPWECALALLQAMPSCRIEPKAAIFNATIRVLERAGLWKEAIHLFATMDSSNACSDLISLNATITACTNNVQWEAAVALLDKATIQNHLSRFQSNRQRSTVSYNVTIVGCGRSSQWQRSLSLLEELRLRVAATTANMPYVPGWGHKQKEGHGDCDRDERVLLLDEQRRSETVYKLCPVQGPTTGASAFLLKGCNATLKGCERASEWQKAVQLLSVMANQEVSHGLANSSESGLAWPSPDILSFNTTISACEKATSWDGALALLEMLLQLSSRAVQVSSRLRADAPSFNSVTRALTRVTQWEAGLELLSKAYSHRIQLNAVSSLMIVYACGRGNCWQGALTELDRSYLAPRMTRLDNPATPRNLHNAIISACEQASRWQEALHLCFSKNGEGQDWHLDQVTLNSALSSCATQKQWALTIEMLDFRRYLAHHDQPICASGFGAAALGCAMAGAWACAVGLYCRSTHLKGWRKNGKHLGGLAMTLLVAIRSCEIYLQVKTLWQLLPQLKAGAGRVLLLDLILPLPGTKDDGFRAEVAEMLRRYDANTSAAAWFAAAQQRLQRPARYSLQGLRVTGLPSAGFVRDDVLESQFCLGTMTKGLVEDLSMCSPGAARRQHYRLSGTSCCQTRCAAYRLMAPRSKSKSVSMHW